MRFRVLLAAFLLPGSAWARECAQGWTAVELEAVLVDAEVAYERLDLVGFRAAASDARRMLPCLSEAVMPPMAARYHRVRGMSAFVDRDRKEAREAFAAARALEPAWRFPTTMVPEGNPLLEDYGAMPLDGGRYEKVPPPAEGRISFDGLPTRMRPQDWPTVVQIFDASGGVRTTRWVRPGDALPRYSESDGPLVEERLRSSRSVGPGARVPLLAGAGAGLVASGVLWALAADAHADYTDGDDFETMDRDRVRGNRLGAAAIGVSAASAATVVVAFVGVDW